METINEVEEWLSNMGFNGKIPETMSNICNSSTYFIWKQLMTNARKKQDVEFIRKSVIINRLKSKPIDNQDHYQYVIPEIEAYRKKIHLQNRSKILTDNISETRSKTDQLSNNCLMKQMSIKHLKTKMNEIEEREYLLGKRCEMLEEDIKNTAESLSKIKSITPTELDEDTNSEEITNTLQKCAEKLEKLFETVPPPSQKLIPNKTISEHSHSVLTPLKYNFASDGEAGSNNKSLKPLCLFNNTKRETPVRSEKRESLGIIPDICIDVISDDDCFLTSHCNITAIDRLQSVKENVPIASQTTILHQSNFHINSTMQTKQVPTWETVMNNKTLIDWFEQLLHSQNRMLIFNHILKNCKNLSDQLKKILLEMGNEKNVENNKYDIAKLHYIHVQIELENLKQEKMVEKYNQQIIQEKEKILVQLRSQDFQEAEITEKITELDLVIKNVELDAALDSMKKEINEAPKVEDNSALIKSNIVIEKQKIEAGLEGVHNLVVQLDEILDKVRYVREETSQSVQKLNQFVIDMDWAKVLSMKSICKEVKVFKEFPLNFNRRFQHVDNTTFFRDICNNILPVHEDIDSDTLHMITNILESPYSPPQTILLNILKAKLKLEALKTINVDVNIPNYKKYSISDLQKQESYIENALSKFNQLINSSTAQKTLTTNTTIKKVIGIWMEMPLKEFIAPNRLVEGHNYKYYEGKYDECCKQ